MAARLASRRSLLGQGGAAAIGLSFGGLAACDGGGGMSAPSVNLYNWNTYTSPEALAEFQRQTGVPVNLSTFTSNDQLFVDLANGNPGYDVIVPAHEFVTRMSAAQMIQELDHSLIPNKANLLPDFQDAAYDPGRRYSMPYAWIVFGIGYRKSALPEGPPNSWRFLFDSPRHSGRIALLQESADLVRMCAKYLGHSVNNIPNEMLSRIEQMLIRQKPHVRFHQDDGQDMLARGEVDLVLEYNGDMAQLIAAPGGEAFGFVVPAEGTLINADCMCIPVGAPHRDEAHAFINFMLSPEAGVALTETIRYPTPNSLVRERMPESYRNNPVIFPPDAVMALSEYGAFEGDTRSSRYEEILARVLAA